MKNEVNKQSLLNLVLNTEMSEPPLYQVCMHNDDYTPMEFVVDTLEKVFMMERRHATEIMLQVHLKGKAICGIFTRDIADTKVSQVVDYARLHEHPLICSLEPA